MSDFRRMFEGESVTSASGGICLSCIIWRERPATWIRRGKVLKVLKVRPAGLIIIKRRKITRSLLSRSTRWWLSLYAETSRAVYSAAWMIYRQRCWWGDLADAVEDTRRRTGVEPVPKLKVSSTNPESKKKGQITSDYFPSYLIIKRCQIMRKENSGTWPHCQLLHYVPCKQTDVIATHDLHFHMLCFHVFFHLYKSSQLIESIRVHLIIEWEL